MSVHKAGKSGNTIESNRLGLTDSFLLWSGLRKQPEVKPLIDSFNEPASYDRILEPNDSFNSQTLAMQSKLQALGYDLEQGHNFANDGVDGYYGKVTTAAVEKFQADSGLDVTGIANEETLALMQEKFSALPEAKQNLANAAPSIGRNYSQTVILNDVNTQNIANNLMQDLQKELGVTPAAAAGIVGNLAHESNGFKSLQEINPLVEGSRGGFGYAQWTGSRRIDFENWSAERGVDPSSYEANKGFLVHELKNTPESKLLDRLDNINSAQDATQIVSNTFLRPGIPHMGSRLAWADRVLKGYDETDSAPTVASAPAPDPMGS